MQNSTHTHTQTERRYRHEQLSLSTSKGMASATEEGEEHIVIKRWMRMGPSRNSIGGQTEREHAAANYRDMWSEREASFPHKEFQDLGSI